MKIENMISSISFKLFYMFRPNVYGFMENVFI